ncbi:response regulator transcription factor [Chitinimonas lacunae]|uniref:Response regulator transcription factor n=1 Tax=Chitinimonas lacunae TaxID=1963018 RepID=A0ABV8MNP9_9NEIS
MNPLRILLIEDHAALAANIIDHLEAAGCAVDHAGHGRQGLALALAGRYDLLILDVQLPGLDGWQVCRTVREQASHHLPVLMLTARDTLEDKLQGFAEGADDYLTKPFALAELEARCQALGRRPRLHRPTRLSIGSLTLDCVRRHAERDGRPLSLSPKAYDLLQCLVEAHPAVVTRSELLHRLWGDHAPDSDALRSHVYALRQALDGGAVTPMLRTLHGVGFRLEADR